MRMDAGQAQPLDYRAVFHKHNLRCTKQRELIYSALMDSREHPTADQLYEAVRSHDQGLSLATVYNTLEALVGCGLARRVPSITTGPSRYDADVGSHAHVALPDGRVEDLPEDLSARLLGAIPQDVLDEASRRLGWDIARVSIHLLARERMPGGGGTDGPVSGDSPGLG
jgi:Fur family transcriptional regulator, peroxide stress response regulator